MTLLLSILAFALSAFVAVGCASVTDEKALLEWLGTSTEDFHATFSRFILPIPIILLVLSFIQALIIGSIPGQRVFSDDAKEKIEKKSTIERILPDHIVDVPCKLKRFFAGMLIEYNVVAVEFVSESDSLRLWNEKGEHKLFEKDFSGRYYEKEVEYFGTEVEPNKFYNISDLITENAEK